MNKREQKMIDNIDFTDTYEIHSLAEHILDKPMSCQQIKNMVFYLMDQIRKNEIIIKKLQEKGKDISSAEYERDYIKYILGLADKPCLKDYKFFQEKFTGKDV